MAHPCWSCGGECYCHGSWDDVVVDLTPGNCESCEYCQEQEEMRHDFDGDKDDDPYWEEDEQETMSGEDFDRINRGDIDFDENYEDD